ncbi:hypothetical protein JW964_17345 [candidate division KSB1 bacterium]|nr:hypothetical protein [candidate division KSB1 bacterium]
MLPINPIYRRLIRKYVPQISKKDLEKYDSYLAYRYHYELKPLRRPPKQSIVAPGQEIPLPDAIEELLRKLKHFKKYIAATYQIWTARRDYAIQQKNLLQLTLSFNSIKKNLGAALYYRYVLITRLPLLWYNKYGYYIIKIVKKTDPTKPDRESRKIKA